MTTTAGSAIRLGFRLARKERAAVWILFAANLALAAVAALPIYRGILGFTGHSLTSNGLASGFSPDWLVDFSFNLPGTLEGYANLITNLGLLALPVNAVLAGGVLARFRTPHQPFSVGDYFRDCYRYAWPMLRLMLIGLIGYRIVFRILNVWLWKFADQRTLNTLDDRVYFWFHLGVGILLILGLALVNLVMDFAQVRLILVEGSTALEAFISSLGFTLTRLPRVILVYAIPSVAGLLLLVIYRLLVPWHFINTAVGSADGASSQEFLALALLFIGQQLVIFARYWFRVATWASEWSYYQRLRLPAGTDSAQ
jgi:hypothetical protein